MSEIAQTRWAWAGASVTGHSHLGRGEACQDSASFHVHASACGPVAVAAVCDGMGSASRSKAGSWLAAIRIQKIVAAYFADGGTVGGIDHTAVARFLAPLHAALAARAAEIRCTIRDLSTTLSLAVVGQDLAHVIQVGDSACVLRCDGEWKVPVWPMNGEYANLTYSVTGFPKVPVGFATICGAVTHIAAFSDGLADLVLDRPSRSAFAPFFEGLFGGAQLVAPCGRNRAVTADLAGYLDSASARERSEDDKTLILAARV